MASKVPYVWPPRKQQILHQYRRLLRAVTYIPDSFARDYAHSFITSRFKANSRRENLRKPNAKELAANRLKKVRQWTRIFESSAQGDTGDLRRILIHAHGRQGARRRVLLNHLLQSEERNLPKDDAALEDLIRKPVDTSTKRLVKGSKLYALCASQTKNHPPGHSKKLRHLDPRIPKENIWGRPTPRKLAESLTNRWMNKVKDKLLPPIPRDEWKRLQGFTTGEIPLEEPSPRRTRGTSAPEEPEMSIDLLLKALRSSARPSLMGIEKLEFDVSRGLAVKPAKMLLDLPPIHLPARARSMRRIYGSIWALSPSLTQQEGSRKWDVEWGRAKSKYLRGEVSTATSRFTELFEGVKALPVSDRPTRRGSQPNKETDLPRRGNPPSEAVNIL